MRIHFELIFQLTKAKRMLCATNIESVRRIQRLIYFCFTVHILQNHLPTGTFLRPTHIACDACRFFLLLGEKNKQLEFKCQKSKLTVRTHLITQITNQHIRFVVIVQADHTAFATRTFPWIQLNLMNHLGTHVKASLVKA